MHIEQDVLQVQKLDKLLSLVRELPEEALAVDKDGASSISEWKNTLFCVLLLKKKEGKDPFSSFIYNFRSIFCASHFYYSMIEFASTQFTT